MNNGVAYGDGFSTDTGYFPWKNANPTYTYRDNMTKIAGNHTLQFGVYFAAAQKNQQNSVYTQGHVTFDTGSPISTGNSFADLLMGNIANYSQTQNSVYYYDRYKITEPYFQDDWRITKTADLKSGAALELLRPLSGKTESGVWLRSQLCGPLLTPLRSTETPGP